VPNGDNQNVYLVVDDRGRLGRVRRHRRWREILDTQIVIEKDGCNLRAVEKILKIVLGMHQKVVLDVQFAVNGLKFFVDRLHFLLGCFQFLIGGL
jgi:hypothetical protein